MTKVDSPWGRELHSGAPARFCSAGLQLAALKPAPAFAPHAMSEVTWGLTEPQNQSGSPHLIPGVRKSAIH